jgi:transposase
MPGERVVKQVLKNRPIPEGKSPLENQERDVCAILKMIRRKWMEKNR